MMMAYHSLSATINGEKSMFACIVLTFLYS